MRAVFSLLGIVIVLAIVGVLIKTQMRSPATSPPSAVASPDLPPVPVVTPANAKQVQDQIKADLERTLQQAPRDVPE